MTQLAGRDTEHNDQNQAYRKGEPDPKGLEGAPLGLVSLIQHQKIETASQAGDQCQRQYYN